MSAVTYFLLRHPSRHLLGIGKQAEARKVIAELNGVPQDDALVEETLEELEYAINAENEGGKATWLECFSTRNALWKRTGNGMMLQFIQQLNGQNFYCMWSFSFKNHLSLISFFMKIIMGILSSRVRGQSRTFHLLCVSVETDQSVYCLGSRPILSRPSSEACL